MHINWSNEMWNESEILLSPVIASKPAHENILTVIGIDTAVSILVVISMALCAWLVWHRHSLAREERDKLGHIMQEVYWDHESEVLQLLDVISTLRQSILFREVTQLHVLAYQYRSKHHILRDCTDGNIYSAINRIQHFFERLRIELPLKGKCPQNVSDCVKHTVQKLAMGCLEFWTDSQISVLQAVVKYFCGSTATDLSSKWISDEELSSMINSRSPYANQLQFSGDHFVLQEIHYDMNMKIDFCSKVRYIDIILARSDPSLQTKQKFLVNIYNSARDICLKNCFILQKSLLPDIPPSGQNDPVSIHDIVMYVRHLIRTMCMEKNLPVVQADEKFCKLLLSLYEQLYGTPEPAIQSEVLQRIKTSIMNSLNAITADQVAIDADVTRAKLEEIEKDLLRHLTFNRIRSDTTKLRRRDLLAAHKHQSAKSFESEASVYTMALSASAFALQRSQGTYESDLFNQHKYISPQQSLDGLYAPNGSLYDTATSTGLTTSTANENTPLISNTPPTPVSRPQSPMSMDSDYYETAV